MPCGDCAVLKGLREGVVSQVSGGYGEGETPLPIPNRAVKPLSADGTWPARAWESRSPPVLLVKPRLLVAGGVLFLSVVRGAHPDDPRGRPASLVGRCVGYVAGYRGR